MTCISGIAKDIISNCTTSGAGGLEVKAWIFNRNEVAVTYDSTKENMITNLVMASKKKCYTISAVKKLLNAGHDIVVADDRPNKYTHYFNCQQFEVLTEDILNVDNLDDVFVVVESKDKTTSGEGIFLAYGVKNGLWKSTDTQRANDLNGARNIELTSLGGQEEKFSRFVVFSTDYATTLALLVGCETAPA